MLKLFTIFLIFSFLFIAYNLVSLFFFFFSFTKLISFDGYLISFERDKKKLNMKISESEPHKEDYVDGIRMYTRREKVL